jgi:hypothetical protein
LTQQQKDLLESLLEPNPKNRKLPKSFPNYSGATITSFPTKKTRTTGKKTSKRPGATSSKVINPYSPKFTVALVVMFFFGGALGLSQVSAFFPELSASEPNATPQVSQGLSNRDFAPGEACGELEIAAETMISSMDQASADVRKSNWANVRPSAEKAINEYESSVIAIRDSQLQDMFVINNLGVLESLTWRFENVDLNSSSFSVIDDPAYLLWLENVKGFFDYVYLCR